MHILIDTLAAQGPMTLKQLIAATGFDRASILELLKEYRDIGKVEELRQGTGRPVEYQLTGAANHSEHGLDMVAANASFSGEKPEVPNEDAKAAVKEYLTVDITAPAASVTQPTPAKESSKPAATRRQPFTPSQLTGYHAKGNGTVTLFLDRRLNAKSVTFTAQQLRKMADDAEAAYANRKSA